MHGIVYVPENEAPSDPLEKEGTWMKDLVTCHAGVDSSGFDWSAHSRFAYVNVDGF